MAVAFRALSFFVAVDKGFKGVIAFFADVFVDGHLCTSAMVMKRCSDK
jgi:hypothetical protein